MKTSEHICSIATLGTPIVIAQLGTIVQSFADTIMVGQYGTAELSAAGFVNNVFNLILFFILGLSYSTTPVVGSFIGAGKSEEARRTLRESVVVSLLGCAFAMTMLTLLYTHLDILNQPRELYPLIRPYFLVLLVSLPFVGIFNSLKQYCDATGDTRTPMWVMIAGNAINIVGNYLLIFTFDLGLLGAGIATLAARVLMAAWMAVTLHKEFGGMRAGRAGIVKLARMGLPISIQLCLEASSFNVCAVFMGWISASALAAHQVMSTVSQVCFMVYYGIGTAAAIRISHFCGQKNMSEVRHTAFTAYGMTLVTGVILTSLTLGLQGWIFRIFTSDAEVIAIAGAIMIPFAVYQFGDCTQIIFANALRGVGRVRKMMTDAAVAYIVVSIPLSYFFGFVLDGGAQGIWWGQPFGLTTAGVIFITRFMKCTKS